MNEPVLEEVLRDAQSDDPDVRGRGMQALWIMVQKDGALSDVALPVFRAALVQSAAADGWTVSNALRGVQKLAGEAEYHATAMEIANYSDAKVAARVVLMLSDPSFTDELIELMRRRPDKEIQISAMRTLGRMRAPAALDPIVANLLNSELRPHAIESLGDLGNARAIPHLEPLLSDRAEAWEEDNHGPMLRVCDLAQTAILKLRSTTPAPPAIAIDPTPAQTQASLAPAPTGAAPLVYAKAQGTLLQPLLPYVPLTLAFLQIPWILMVIFGVVVFHDDLKSHAATRVLDAVAMLPGLVGLAVGIYVLTRRPSTLAPRICLILGMIGCALPQFSFGYELFH